MCKTEVQLAVPKKISHFLAASPYISNRSLRNPDFTSTPYILEFI